MSRYELPIAVDLNQMTSLEEIWWHVNDIQSYALRLYASISNLSNDS